jgi:hypothetical protein
MALFLIIEPDEDIRRLYAAVVRGLGHEAAFFDGLPTGKPDVVLVEPADPNSLAAALRLQHDDRRMHYSSRSRKRVTEWVCTKAWRGRP